jgi:hypothetical protein
VPYLLTYFVFAEKLIFAIVFKIDPPPPARTSRDGGNHASSPSRDSRSTSKDLPHRRLIARLG